MRSIVLPALGLAAGVGFLACGPVSAAEKWEEFSFPESNFAAQFPARPALEQKSYRTVQSAGGTVNERVYSFNQGGVVYMVRVADFSQARADKDKTIDEAANALIAQGKLTIDYPGRIDWNYGREIVVVDKDGTSFTNAIFFVDQRLYQIEVIYPAANSDPVGSSGIGLFQTAFRFLNR
jgi:hypothetical protein